MVVPPGTTKLWEAERRGRGRAPASTTSTNEVTAADSRSVTVKGLGRGKLTYSSAAADGRSVNSMARNTETAADSRSVSQIAGPSTGVAADSRSAPAPRFRDAFAEQRPTLASSAFTGETVDRAVRHLENRVKEMQGIRSLTDLIALLNILMSDFEGMKMELMHNGIQIVRSALQRKFEGKTKKLICMLFRPTTQAFLDNTSRLVKRKSFDETDKEYILTLIFRLIHEIRKLKSMKLDDLRRV